MSSSSIMNNSIQCLDYTDPILTAKENSVKNVQTDSVLCMQRIVILQNTKHSAKIKAE